MTQFLIALFVILAQVLAPANLAPVVLQNNQATLNFPDQVTFQADLQAVDTITEVILEYRLPEQTTCGTVVSKAFPEFSPAKQISVSWTWEMKQSGSLPPGAQISWRWRVKDASGKETLTEEQTITWIDTQHNWKVIEGDGIALYYYDRTQSQADELHQTAVNALQRLKNDIGFQFDQVVKLYIYANNDEMKTAVLYEPGWTGGQAYPEHRIIIIGIEPSQWDWGKSTEAHELTHVLIGQLTFTCLGDMPTWLNEGLAMYGEGGPEQSETERFNQAVADNSISAIRSLSGGFSEDSDRANLSYTQSFSVVNFLLKNYTQAQMLTLLDHLRTGDTIDQALQAAYGFADTEALEDAWRTNINASPRLPDSNEQATPTPTPTQVPTLQPVSGDTMPTPMPSMTPPPVTDQGNSQVMPQPTPQVAEPMPTAAPANAQPAQSSQPSPLVYALIILGVLAVLVILLFIGRSRRRG